MSLHDHEPTGRDQPIAADQVPAEEDLDRGEVAEDLEESGTEKPNYTDEHPFDDRMTEGG